MDRFIAGASLGVCKTNSHLKSNMDRFIVHECRHMHFFNIYLKSNMDRFIDVANELSKKVASI